MWCEYAIESILFWDFGKKGVQFVEDLTAVAMEENSATRISDLSNQN